MYKLQIRPATPHDRPDIETIAALAYAPYIPRIGRRPAPMDADYAAQIASGDIHVATQGTAVLGFIACRMTGPHMFLENIAVHPDATGQGIGQALMQFCETSARAANAQSIRLYTNARMTENLTLYPHLGYSEYDRRSENGFDRVYFEKKLG